MNLFLAQHVYIYIYIYIYIYTQIIHVAPYREQKEVFN